MMFAGAGGEGGSSAMSSSAFHQAVQAGDARAEASRRAEAELTAKGPISYKALNDSHFLVKFGWLIVPVYLGLGTGFYYGVEGWSFIDSLYFVCVCLTTVGYGDMEPKSDGSKVFTCLFVLVGLSLVATSLGAMLSQLQNKLARSRGSRPPPWRQLLITLLSLGLLLTVGAVFVHFTEEWPWGDCFYWAVITCTSIGFGDFSPKHWSGRLFATFYVLVAVGCFATSLGQLSAVIMDYETERAVKAFIARGVSPELIRDIDADGSGSVDKLEFLTHMLLSTGKLERPDIDGVLALFDSLDVDGSGQIGPEDCIGAQPLPSSLQSTASEADSGNTSWIGRLRSRSAPVHVQEGVLRDGTMREPLVRAVE